MVDKHLNMGYYKKTVTGILSGNSIYEREICDILSDNISLFASSANEGFRHLKHSNKLPKYFREEYSSFTGTSAGILIEFYLSRYQESEYVNDKVNAVLKSCDLNAKKAFEKYNLNYDIEWLRNAYEKVNKCALEEIETLADLAMDFSALESYYRSGKKSCFKPLLTYEDTNEKTEVYYLIMADIIELVKSFETTVFREEVLTGKDEIIINPVFADSDLIAGDGDFIINNVLYELKCLTNSSYEYGNSKQLMFYYILNELNKYKRKSVAKFCTRTGLEINELKVLNPRYEAVINFEIRLKDDLVGLGEKIINLIEMNSKLYFKIWKETIDRFINDSAFFCLSKNEKINQIKLFYFSNNKYRFIMDNKDWKNFIEKIVKAIEVKEKQSELNNW